MSLGKKHFFEKYKNVVTEEEEEKNGRMEEQDV